MSIPLLLSTEAINAFQKGQRNFFGTARLSDDLRVCDEVYLQEEFDVEITSGRWSIYYRADYPNSGWRNWMAGRDMLEVFSRYRARITKIELHPFNILEVALRQL